MRHPLMNIDDQRRNSLFLLLFGLTIVIMMVMNSVGSSLNTEEAPYGIVSFELAGRVPKAQAILDSWDAAAQVRAAFIQGLDFLFLIVYSTTIALACLWAGKTLKRAGWAPAGLGIPLAWGLWIAAICDAVENYALVRMLFVSITSPWPGIAAVCAVIKFALIFLGLVYALYALVIKFATSRKSSATEGR
jgi:small-conductance mechanosensitive channel